MADLFRILFATEPLDTSVQMWWDILCYDWHCGNRKRERERGGEDERMQDVIFQTLTAILALDSGICQRAALHGLGHLHHPETENLIQRYIAETLLSPGSSSNTLSLLPSSSCNEQLPSRFSGYLRSRSRTQNLCGMLRFI
jgi:hypothetical protein